MRRRRGRRTNDGAEDGIKVVRELVAAGVNVDRGGKGLDEKGLFNPPAMPVLFRRENGDVLFPEVVAIFAGMLKHGRFVFAKGVR